MNTTTIKYLLIILAVSFLFSCVAQAQTDKELLAGNSLPDAKAWKMVTGRAKTMVTCGL